jgi:hypothetical protein
VTARSRSSATIDVAASSGARHPSSSSSASAAGHRTASVVDCGGTGIDVASQ